MQVKWRKKYNELFIYIEENKTLPTCKDKVLKNWLSAQQRAYKDGNLEKYRIDLLIKVDKYIFNHKKKLDAIWLENYKKFLASPPKNKNSPMYGWYASQKTLFNNGELNKNRARLLAKNDDYFKIDIGEKVA